MATAFSYSGTGLESAIATGSGGLSSTGTSVEVDSIPADLSAGDTVKVALGTATQWSNGNGETVYGDIGTIGGGANGGTDITGLSRGQEGTSAASWSEGDPVRVGVQGRDDVGRTDLQQPIITPGGPTSVYRFPPSKGGKLRQPSLDTTLFTYIQTGIAVEVKNVTFVVSTGGSTDGSHKSALFGISENNLPSSTTKITDIAQPGALDLSTSGTKTISLSQTIDKGLYWIATRLTGYSTTPELRFANTFENIPYAYARNKGSKILNRQRTDLSSNDDFGSLSSFTTSEVNNGMIQFLVEFGTV